MAIATGVLTRDGATVTVEVDAPDGWTSRQLDASSFAVVGPTEPGTFTPNVVVSADEPGTDRDRAVVVAAVRDARDGLPEVALVGEGERDVAGVPWFVTEYAFADPRAGTVMQAVRVAATDGGAVVRVTATCSGATARTELPRLRQVMDSVRW